jgi:hypothetical protein
MCFQILKICSLGLLLASLCGCLTLEESALKKTPDEILKWSDEYLCQNAYWKNSSIKTELIRRKLLSTEEYDLLYVQDEIRNFPRVKMPKCAMWTYATDSKLIKKQPLEDGAEQELWRIEKGEKFLFFFGGHKFNLTFVNNRITEIVANQ